MAISNYPNGFTDGIVVRGKPIQLLHPGKVFWVNNSTVLPEGGIGGSDSNPGTYLKPFRTLDYAIGKCTANRGDIIAVMPTHAENVSAAAGIVVDVAGIAIVGLGSGTARPKFSFTAAAADIDITAANVSFYNIEFQANFADVTAGLDVSGVDGLSFESCYFTEAGTDLNFVDTIDLATGADDISFNDCVFIGNDAANDSFITGVAHDKVYISNSQFQMNTAQAAVVGLIETSGNATNVWIKNCAFRSNVDGALFLDFNGAANSGVVSECYFSSIDVAGATTAGFDFTGGHVFECYVAGEADTYGIVGGGSAYNDA
jgi:pectate lyase